MSLGGTVLLLQAPLLRLFSRPLFAKSELQGPNRWCEWKWTGRQRGELDAPFKGKVVHQAWPVITMRIWAQCCQILWFFSRKSQTLNFLLCYISQFLNVGNAFKYLKSVCRPSKTYLLLYWALSCSFVIAALYIPLRIQLPPGLCMVTPKPVCPSRPLWGAENISNHILNSHTDSCTNLLLKPKTWEFLALYSNGHQVLQSVPSFPLYWRPQVPLSWIITLFTHFLGSILLPDPSLSPQIQLRSHYLYLRSHST